MRTKLNKIVGLAKEYRDFAIEQKFANENSEEYIDVRVYINNTKEGEYFTFSTKHNGKDVKVTIFKLLIFSDSKESVDVTFDISLSNKELEAVYIDAKQTLKEWRAELNKKNE